MRIAIIAPFALAGALFGSACLAEPIQITNPEKLDTIVMDSGEAVLFVLCRGGDQCAQAQSLLRSAEGDARLAAALSAPAGAKPAVKLVFADAADLPVLSEGWDADDRKVCLNDPAKTEGDCADLKYPVFILKNGTQKSGKIAAGVEELARGAVDKEGVVSMILHAAGAAR